MKPKPGWPKGASGSSKKKSASRAAATNPKRAKVLKPAVNKPAAKGGRRGQRNLRTLSIDIGGTGIKMIVLNSEGTPINQRLRELTPKPATPAAVLALIQAMAQTQPRFDRVSVGFPGVVKHGVVYTAANLGKELWSGFDLQAALHELIQLPVRVLNDADLQGFGVISGRGVEMVITLGTGIGVGLYTNGHLVNNCELGHHPWKKGRTYEQRLSDAELARIGKRRWSARVNDAVDTLRPIFNWDRLYLGGGNARHIRFALPQDVHIFTNVEGMMGGSRLWALEP